MKTLRLSNGILLFMCSICLFSCNHHEIITIGVSRLNPAYHQWLLQIDSNLKIIDLYSLPFDSVMLALDECDGLLITGGEDIYPLYYGKEFDTSICEAFDLHRDTLEFMAFEKALHRGLPIFGICRGLQLINVALGGSLIADIPSELGTEVIHRCDNRPDCLHPVTVNGNSLLYSITGAKEVYVNSIHHQGIDRLADELKPAAFAPDQLIEVIEWRDPTIHNNFLMAVQWHPERLTVTPEMSQPLGMAFIRQAKLYHESKKSKD